MKKFLCLCILSIIIGCSSPVVEEKTELLRLHNFERQTKKIYPLSINSDAMKSAQKHADWMAKKDKMSHTGEHNSQPWDRIEGDWSLVGENIAYGADSPDDVMSMWMKSTGHKKNILSKDFKGVGFGIAYHYDKNGNKTKYWCTVFTN